MLSSKEYEEERIMMGLRLKKGLHIDGDGYREKVIEINRLSDDRLIEFDSESLRLTEHGRPLLNAILRELLA